MKKWQPNALATAKRITTIFIVVALASILLVSGGLNFFLRRAALTVARANLNSMAFQMGKHCESTINGARLDLEFMAGMSAFKQLSGTGLIDPAVNGLPETEDSEKRQLFAQMMKKSDDFSNLFVLRPNGDVYLAYPFEAQKNLGQTTFADEKYYQDALETKNTVISDAFISAGGNLSAAILVPLSDGSGKIIGYLGGGLKLITLAGLMASQEIAPFDFAALIDNHGQVIVNTTASGKTADAKGFVSDRNPIISRFVSSAPAFVSNEPARVMEDEYDDPISRKHYLEALYPMGSGWGMFLLRDKSSVLNEVAPGIRGMSLITALLILLICGFGVFIAHTTGELWKKTEFALRESEGQHGLLISQMQQGLALHEIILDEAGNPADYRFLNVNKSFEQLTGLKSEDIIGKTVLEVLPKTEKYWIEMYGHVAMTGEPIIQVNYSRELKKYYEISAYSVRMKQFAVIMSDITERIISANELRETKEYLEKLIDDASAPIVVWSAGQVIMRMNRAFERLLGRSANQLIGEELRALFTDEKTREALTRIGSMAKGETIEAMELDIGGADGDIRTVLWNTAAIYDNDGINVISVIAQGQDITDRKKAENDLVFQNRHDYLTGMYNRQFFEEELERLNISGNLPLSVIIFDVNGLKLINDSFGHNAGDEYLKKTANVIMKNCLADCIAARLGGDEFALILPGAGSEKAAEISSQIKENAMKEKIEHIEMSISYGYDTKSSVEMPMNELLANAENHMYRHKVYERSSLRSKTIDIIMRTLFEKSNREMMHSRRVSEICRDIAAHMDFSEADVNQIKTAGLIHDIGKIGIDERILNKNERLNPDEWEQMKRHPEGGWRIVSSVSEFSDLSQFILCHHEKWDGSGYPNGLKQEEIPLEARIIAIADAYDAMTNERSYHQALSKENAIMEISRCSGTQFDPKVVAVFINEVLPGIFEHKAKVR